AAAIFPREAAANRGLFYVNGQPRSPQALLERLNLDADATMGAGGGAQGGRVEYARDGQMSPALANALFAMALLPLLRSGEDEETRERDPMQALNAYARTQG
ncbi:MAG: hypothetical protein K2X34_02965, partial [Hyphomonadaceae bacterium]|nr:hypothetical protein [Hyphomonadaceae bacterium]